MKKLAILLAAICLLVSCASTEKQEAVDNDTLYQVNLLQSLMLGYYDGTMTVGDLKARGDFGIGTFDGVNGELVMVDGVVYQVLYDGSVVVAADDEGIPFSNYTRFDVDDTVAVENISDIGALKAELDKYIFTHSPNSFYTIRIDGVFDSIYTRSEYKQERPYRPLDEALATDQTEFKYENVEGTLIVLYCPSYMGGLNTPGYHLHFVSLDRTKGGHVLDLSSKKLTCHFDKADSFRMDLSDNDEFNALPLDKEMGDKIRMVEQGN